MRQYPPRGGQGTTPIDFLEAHRVLDDSLLATDLSNEGVDHIS